MHTAIAITTQSSAPHFTENGSMRVIRRKHTAMKAIPAVVIAAVVIVEDRSRTSVWQAMCIEYFPAELSQIYCIGIRCKGV